LADEAGDKPASFLLLQVLQLQIEKKFSTLSFVLAAEKVTSHEMPVFSKR
jgi:hypothetical protein